MRLPNGAAMVKQPALYPARASWFKRTGRQSRVPRVGGNVGIVAEGAVGVKVGWLVCLSVAYLLSDLVLNPLRG